MSVLIYTRNYTPEGKGFVHDNIAVCAAALKELCAQSGLSADVSDDPAVFTEAGLQTREAVVFANSRTTTASGSRASARGSRRIRRPRRRTGPRRRAFWPTRR